jgi:putative ABC transport system substrate-binding protein
MITRRDFIGTLAGGLLAVPLAAAAQQAGRVWRIGFLGLPSASSAAARVEAFRRGLRELGYVEGRNLAIEFRWAEGNADRLPALAAEVTKLKVDVIVTQGTEATVAAHRSTTTIPIVVTVISDPVGTGLVRSLARPGGNVTGLTDIAEEVAGKRIEVLREAVPSVTRIAVLWNPANASSGPQMKDMEAAGRKLGLSVRSIEVRDVNQLDGAFATAVRDRAGAVVVLPDAALFGRRDQIAQLAVKNRLPSLAWTPEFTKSGCLMIYGPNVLDMHGRAATYVDKILKGAKPGDLPVEQPTTLELVINLKTAKALGLTIPQSLLLRADELIQ